MGFWPRFDLGLKTDFGLEVEILAKGLGFEALSWDLGFGDGNLVSRLGF